MAAATAGVAVPPAGAATHHRHRHHRKHHRHHRHHRHHAVHPAGQRTNAQPSEQVPQVCPNADAPATSASLNDMRAAVVCLINQQRVAHGLPTLKVSWDLNQSAQGWNNSMVASGDFTHGTNFAGRISAAGYDWQSAGENIATGFDTPHSVVAAWMASTDHCRNILDPSFRDVGTGETPAPVGDSASGPSTWTQDFGLQMSQSPLSGNTGPQNGCPY